MRGFLRLAGSESRSSLLRTGPKSARELSATILNNLALLYHEQNKYALAEPLDQRSLALREILLPVGHLDLAQSLNNLTELYQDRGNYPLAESFLQQALTINKPPFGDELVRP